MSRTTATGQKSVSHNVKKLTGLQQTTQKILTEEMKYI
jgi:hypothetical protein